MVKIRYAELPAGLHVVTEAGDRCTIVYLKPGLTRAQRKDALMVARRSARFGHGPSLPTLDMAFALAADRTRTTARITGWAMRNHPFLLLPLLALVLGIIAASFLASAAIVTVTPRMNSAQSSGLSQSDIGRLVTPQASSSPGSRSGPPRSGIPGPAAGVQGQPRSHGRTVRHSRPRTRDHLAAGTAPAAPAGQWQVFSPPGGDG